MYKQGFWPISLLITGVATDRQGASGLGLDAQRRAAAGFVSSGQLVSEFTEVSSGCRCTNRPQLLAALADCRKRRAAHCSA